MIVPLGVFLDRTLWPRPVPFSLEASVAMAIGVWELIGAAVIFVVMHSNDPPQAWELAGTDVRELSLLPAMWCWAQGFWQWPRLLTAVVRRRQAKKREMEE